MEKQNLLTTRTIKYKNNLTIVIHQLFNGDTLYFASYYPTNSTDAVLKLYVKDNSPLVSVRHLAYKEPGSISNSYWVKKICKPGPLPKETLYINNIALSLVDVFTPTANETIKENYSLSPPVIMSETGSGYEYKIILPGRKGKVINHWGIISGAPLVDWEFESTNQQVRLADLNRHRKLLPRGFMEKVAATYVPGDKDTFWWCPHQTVGEAFLRHDETKNRIFTDIACVVLYELIKKQNEQGYWYSTPESTWLSKDYGIGRYYFDTRFCTDAGMYLLQAYEKYQEPGALESAKKYGDYLIAHIVKGKNTGNGILSPDYWSNPAPRVMPHTSLNHQLAEMNFLYRLYLNTGEALYREYAVLLKNAIKDTGMKWVNPQGDLWYCVTSKGVFGLPDYEVLTLLDLIKANDYILKAEGQQDIIIEKLRAAKYSYAKGKNYISW